MKNPPRVLGAGDHTGTDTPAWGEPVEPYTWGQCASDSDADYWRRLDTDKLQQGVSGITPQQPADSTPSITAGAELLSVGDELLADLATARALLNSVAGRLGGVFSPELTGLAAEATAVVAAAEAARAAIVLDADARGVIASTDNPRVDRFIEQACRDAGVPVTTRHARTLREVATACDGHEVRALRDAVVSGRVTVESAALAAQFYRRLKPALGPGSWNPVLEAVIEAVRVGATARDLEAMAETIIAQHGTPGDLDREHEAAYVCRSMSVFRRDRRTGMMTATVRLDPASEAVVTAAITALSTPAPVEDGDCGTAEPDQRTPEQRRADALVMLAGVATRHNGELPLTGSKAKVIVTINHDALAASLDEAGFNPLTGHRYDCAITNVHASAASRAGAVFGASSTGDGFGNETGDVPGADGCDCGSARGVGVTEHGQVLAACEVRMLACDAGIIPMVLGGQGEPLDVGREQRLATPAQRAYLIQRDKGCSFTGCAAPPSWCDAHHLLEWGKGGRSDRLNYALLCRHHHREVHSKGHVGTASEHSVNWTRADGAPLGNSPRPERCR